MTGCDPIRFLLHATEPFRFGIEIRDQEMQGALSSARVLGASSGPPDVFEIHRRLPHGFLKVSSGFPQGFQREGEIEVELETEVESEVEVEIEYISKTEEIFCFGERGRAGASSRSPAGRRIDFDHFFGLPF